MTDLFLDREQEFETITKAITAGKSLIIYGDAGCGKTALLQKVRAHFETGPADLKVLYVSPTRNLHLALREMAMQVLRSTRPHPEIGQVIRLMGDDTERSIRRYVEGSSSTVCRRIVLREVAQSPVAIIFDHTGFLSHTFCEFAKRLMMEFNLSLVFAGRSCHMEDVGCISKSLCGPGERLLIKNLSEENVDLLVEHCMRKNWLRPSSVSDFKAELIELSHGNAGRIVKMCEMASLEKYRFGREIKLRLIHIDSQLGELETLTRSRGSKNQEQDKPWA
jgi:hypothetical protein